MDQEVVFLILSLVAVVKTCFKVPAAFPRVCTSPSIPNTHEREKCPGALQCCQLMELAEDG